MKTLKIPLLFFILCLCNCQNEKKEIKESNSELYDIEYYKSEIDKKLIYNLDRLSFNMNILPLIIELEKKDPKRTKMIKVIALKLSKETNLDAFKSGHENLQKEIDKRYKNL